MTIADDIGIIGVYAVTVVLILGLAWIHRGR